MSLAEEVADYRHYSRQENPLLLSAQDEIILSRQHDLVEDCWRDYLEVYEDCTVASARAKGALYVATYVREQLAAAGIYTPINSLEDTLPILTNEMIAFVAQTELIKFYRQSRTPNSAVKAEYKNLDGINGLLNNQIVGLLGSLGREERPRGVETVLDSLRYASLVVLGNISDASQRMVIARAMKHLAIPAEDYNPPIRLA